MRYKISLLAAFFFVLIGFNASFEAVVSGLNEQFTTIIFTGGNRELQEPFVSYLEFILKSRFNQLASIYHLEENKPIPDLLAYNRIIYYGLDSHWKVLASFKNKVVDWLKGDKNRHLIWLGYNGDAFDFEPWGFKVNQEPVKGAIGKMYYYGKNNRIVVFNLNNPDLFSVDILKPEQIKIEALVATLNGAKPIIITGKSLNDYWGEVTYVGYHPTAYLEKLSGLIPFTDLLHEVYIYTHNRKLLFIRLEDWHPYSNTEKFKAAVDYITKQQIYYTISVIPAYAEGNSVSATLETEAVKEKLYQLLQAPYVSIVIHGYTHQLTGITGIDYEFYDEKKDQYLEVEESRKRIKRAIELILKANLAALIAGWETPHYRASFEVYRDVFEKQFSFIFENCNHNILCQYLPYYLKFGSISYLNTILGYVEKPENSHEIVEYAAILSNLRHAVEIGLFYHPEIFGVKELPSLIDAFKKQGWESISLFTLLNY